ncbi:TPA: hypothetical protein I7712_00285 [Vibrio vulnificus]|nr:hypothetical protein CRN22_10040 [Vibrio vulnificus]RAH21621.1 hypothetical protein DOT35_19670 [Vibrio vulnificus]HAS6042152.1 hypothetical protein [Vibrio vulnificus]HAS6160093.1 hypothetical protein [Vibrio vulnificus]HAS8129927.1 hypothetical protein [Vibrio vulnificus]
MKCNFSFNYDYFRALLRPIIPEFICLKNNLKCDFYHQNRIFYSIESPSVQNLLSRNVRHEN